MNITLAQRISSTKHLGHQIPKPGRFQRHNTLGDGQKPFLKNSWRGWCDLGKEAAFFFLRVLALHGMSGEGSLQPEQQGMCRASSRRGLLNAQQLPREAMGPLGIGFVPPRTGISPLDKDFFISAPLGCWASLPPCHPTLHSRESGQAGLPLLGLLCTSPWGHQPTAHGHGSSS